MPAAIGEAHYIGERAYERLEFHYYFADLDSAEDGPVCRARVDLARPVNRCAGKSDARW